MKPELRRAMRVARCRACDTEIDPGTPMISWYSSANRGMHIHICLKCSDAIGRLSHEKVKEPEDE